jgi:hypothetical protein
MCAPRAKEFAPAAYRLRAKILAMGDAPDRPRLILFSPNLAGILVVCPHDTLSFTGRSKDMYAAQKDYFVRGRQ